MRRRANRAKDIFPAKTLSYEWDLGLCYYKLFFTLLKSQSVRPMGVFVPSKQDNTEVDTNGLEQKYNCHPKREHRRLWS